MGLSAAAGADHAAVAHGGRAAIGAGGVGDAQAARGVALIDTTLAEEGPLSRAQLRERLERARGPVRGQALVHLLVRASIDA